MNQGMSSFFALATAPLHRSKSQLLLNMNKNDDPSCWNRPQQTKAITSSQRTVSRQGSVAGSRAASRVGSRDDSLAGMETTVAPFPISSLKNSPHIVTSSYSRSPTVIGQPSPAFSQSPKSVEKALVGRRNVHDLILCPMSTVKECYMDSPTIPGRPPVTLVSPRATQLSLDSDGEVTPRALPIIMASEKSQKPAEFFKSKTKRERGHKRASSEILPNGLAPLVIPTNKESVLSSQTYSPSKQENAESAPPRVPPKSPRTLIRAFPQPKSNPVSAKTSTTTLHSTYSSHASKSSVSSIGSAEERNHTKPWNTQSRGSSPRTGQRSLSINTNTDRSSPVPWTAPLRDASLRPLLESLAETDTNSTGNSTLPWVMREYHSSPNRHTRNKNSRSESEPASTVQRDESRSYHSREMSEGSVINRGRPMKRTHIYLQHRLSPDLDNPLSAKPFEALPTGIRNSQVLNNMPLDELHLLRKHAVIQAGNFSTLSEKEVNGMTNELLIVSELCDHIRKTCTSLRNGRQTLHERLLVSLNSVDQTLFPREKVLKQEVAVSALDKQIDRWSNKLREAEDRKCKIQKILMEHMVAVLALKIPQDLEIKKAHSEPTPPISPETPDRSFSTERKDVESIKIYADSGVASLLASIEREIDMMDQSGRFEV